MSNEQLASFNPDDAAEGKPLFSEGDAEIVEAKIELYDYNGKSTSGPDTGIRIGWQVQGADGPETLREFYKLGKPDTVVPSADGKSVLFTGQHTQLWKKSDGVQLLSAVTDSGVAKTFLKNDISVLVGAKFRIIRVNKKDKDGAEIKKTNGYLVTMLVPSKLLSLPGEKPAKGAVVKPAAKASAPAAPAAVDAASVSDEVRDRTIRYIYAATEKGAVARKGLPQAVFPALMKAKDPAAKQIGTIVFDAKFLAAAAMTPVEGEAFLYDAEADTVSRAA